MPAAAAPGVKCRAMVLVILAFALGWSGVERPPSRSAADAALVAAARKAWVGRAWFLRGFPRGDEIRFAADGSPLKRLKPGPWTLADMEITGVRGRRAELDVSGWRVGLSWRGRQAKFVGYRLHMIRLRVLLGHSLPGPEAVGAIGSRLFIRTTAALARAVPRYWRPFVLADLEHRAAFPARRTPGPKCCQTVRRPQLRYNPQPEYNRWAGRAVVGGRTKLTFVVTASGRVRDIVVVEALGMGLDDSAVAALRRWRFDPTRCGGKAVASPEAATFGFPRGGRWQPEE